MTVSHSVPLFDVDAPSPTNNLAFQDFSSTTIAADVPLGRISPSGTPQVGGATNRDMYVAGNNIGNSISGATKSGGVLSLDYYTGYFDVDTVTVLTRCLKTLLPREDYVAEVLAGVPDLYGPFWVPTTLIFSLFLTSSLSGSINAYLAGQPYTYDFTRLGAAVSLVYTYSLGLPLIVWAALKYWAGVDERSPVEIVSVYGYASTIWILVSWLTLIPYGPLQLVLVAGGTFLSLYFIVRNLYPIIATSQNASARLLVIVVASLHLILGMALWFGFMAGGTGLITDNPNKPQSPIGGGGSGTGEMPPSGEIGQENPAVAMLARMLRL